MSRRLLPLLLLAACTAREAPKVTATVPGIDSLLAQYTTVRLEADLSGLSDHERQMLPPLIDAARVMDDIYWREMIGPRDSVLGMVADSALRRYVDINYGPWDRLDGLKPFIPGTGEMPLGANFYPADLTKAGFDSIAATLPDSGAALRSLYTLVRWNGSGSLTAVPYHVAFQPLVERAADRLRAAAALADDPGLKRYLELRAKALLDDDYRPSDIAWLDMKDNGVDVVIGPIETYDDRLFGYKAAHEAYVLVKDRDWSARLARYATLLPALQHGIPVEAAYKRETPGTDSDLNAYDVVYYAGQSNSGSKTIAINLPNDETVQLEKGTRRLQLKNAVRAKFDRILMPIANELIAADQRRFLAFDAFFENVMFHEVAHGLGIKHTINGRGTVRTALKEEAGALEEGKADVLGLYMVHRLAAGGELGEHDTRTNDVTFIASIFRSVRFGGASAHGRANVAAFNFLHELGAFARDSATGTYAIDFAKMPPAVDSLSATILRFQGNGDYAGVQAFVARYGTIGAELQGDLDRLATKGIPVDVVFEQGPSVLGLPAAR